MKTVEIIGSNYFGSWEKTRTACRGVILDGEKLLLSYETVSGSIGISSERPSDIPNRS